MPRTSIESEIKGTVSDRFFAFFSDLERDQFTSPWLEGQTDLAIKVILQLSLIRE
jgi:hypothetical protein